MKLSMDKNGNKILVLKGFSIQTNGNLPLTHAMTKDNFDLTIATNEAKIFIANFGTNSQKIKLGV